MTNPEITHLVPVLKYYWLITSSYGFFSVGGFLGLTVLILLRPLLKNPTIEMSQTIVLLTVVTLG
ncbi:MAG: hypothetical protein ACFIN2_00325 [Candidatus Walczuchella monophlebidarum]